MSAGSGVARLDLPPRPWENSRRKMEHLPATCDRTAPETPSDEPMNRRYRRLPTAFLATLLLAGCGGSINHYLLRVRDSGADDETVAEAVVELGRLLAEAEASGRPFDTGEREAIEFLKDVASIHTNPVIRMQALSSLRQLERLDLTDLYMEALDHEHWGVRWEAARGLAARPSFRATGKLAERLGVEKHTEVNLEVVEALRRVGDHEALKALLDAFLDTSGRHRDYRLKIYVALKELSGRTYPFVDWDSWRTYRDELAAADEQSGEKPPEPEPALPDSNADPTDPTESEQKTPSGGPSP